jgi:hypothetical protein
MMGFLCASVSIRIVSKMIVTKIMKKSLRGPGDVFALFFYKHDLVLNVFKNKRVVTKLQPKTTFIFHSHSVLLFCSYNCIVSSLNLASAKIKFVCASFKILCDKTL